MIQLQSLSNSSTFFRLQFIIKQALKIHNPHINLRINAISTTNIILFVANKLKKPSMIQR